MSVPSSLFEEMAQAQHSDGSVVPKGTAEATPEDVELLKAQEKEKEQRYLEELETRKKLMEEEEETLARKARIVAEEAELEKRERQNATLKSQIAELLKARQAAQASVNDNPDEHTNPELNRVGQLLHALRGEEHECAEKELRCTTQAREELEKLREQWEQEAAQAREEIEQMKSENEQLKRLAQLELGKEKQKILAEKQAELQLL